jgi:hypothetical protein
MPYNSINDFSGKAGILWEEAAMLKKFKEFAMRRNIVDMAAGIVIGTAFGAGNQKMYQMPVCDSHQGYRLRHCTSDLAPMSGEG